MKIVVIDGQGGSLGKAITEKIKSRYNCEIYAIGTNSIATSAMLKAGADYGVRMCTDDRYCGSARAVLLRSEISLL